ncbi:hypothetical protein JOE46_004030 [Rhodococcus sp. PvR099]|nr:hypothetical protein [Rhodococcus sp. PvR099]PTR37222.1 hypothetical protein C8K38_121109 [Rhodococcus sp. OK611]SNX93555.1 hypothetical protein SAMN05447004_121109 [Rhodococcus sp. OK270]
MRETVAVLLVVGVPGDHDSSTVAAWSCICDP